MGQQIEISEKTTLNELKGIVSSLLCGGEIDEILECATLSSSDFDGNAATQASRFAFRLGVIRGMAYKVKVANEAVSSGRTRVAAKKGAAPVADKNKRERK